ncbi:GAF domain-containing protein, partial [Nitrospirota bacterium]
MKGQKILGVLGVLALLALVGDMISKRSYEPSFSIIETSLLALAFLSIIALSIGKKVKPAPPVRETPPPPPDISGFQDMEDTQLAELLRAALYTLNASDISFFELIDEKPKLQYTNSPLGTPVPLWFLDDVLRYRHTISTGQLSAPPEGTIPDSRAVSIVAAPVMDSNVVLGILAISNPKVDAFAPHISHALDMFASQVARTQGSRRVQAATEDIMQQLRILHEESTELVATLDLPSLTKAVAEAMERVDESMDVSILLKTGDQYTLMYQGGPIEEDRPEYSLEGTLADMAV